MRVAVHPVAGREDRGPLLRLLDELAVTPQVVFEVQRRVVVIGPTEKLFARGTHWSTLVSGGCAAAGIPNALAQSTLSCSTASSKS